MQIVDIERLMFEGIKMLIRTQFIKKKRVNAKDKGSSRASRGNSAELSVVLSRETEKSSSGKHDRPLCFDCMRAACSRGRGCDYWHPLRSRDFKSKQYKGKKELSTRSFSRTKASSKPQTEKPRKCHFTRRFNPCDHSYCKRSI